MTNSDGTPRCARISLMVAGSSSSTSNRSRPPGKYSLAWPATSIWTRYPATLAPQVLGRVRQIEFEQLLFGGQPIVGPTAQAIVGVQ